MRRTWYASDRREQAGGITPGVIVMGVVAALILVVPGAIRLAGTAGGVGGTGNPWGFLVELGTGAVEWTTVATVVLVVLAVLVLVVVVAGVLVWRKVRAGKDPAVVRADEKAKSMAQPAELKPLRPEGAAADAARLGCSHVGAGNPIGSLVVSAEPLRSSYEWVGVWIMGPRAGKTSCVCVRQVLENQGPALVTSNKRDLTDLTRGPRSRMGRAWVFDPQGLIGEEQQMWWNPLSYITSYPDRMMEKADELASLFNSSVAGDDSRSDAYFEPRAENLLSALLLAAAIADRPITKVWTWLMTLDRDSEPFHALQLAGYDIAAQTIQEMSTMPHEQRGGVLGTATKMLPWLRSPAIVKWITPQDGLPEFDPLAFVSSGNHTVYSISQEGAGSARAVTGALTVAILRAGEHVGGKSPGGRLRTPLIAVLDEAANVVRWRALPDMYSHFGSRGIVVSSFLQSWSQGVEAWGEGGMRKLWSAANIRVVGSGQGDEKFLSEMVHLIGDHDEIAMSSSSSGTGLWASSSNKQLERKAIFDVGELTGLPGAPNTRGVLLSAGARSAMIKLEHWSTQPYAADVAASQEYYEKLASTSSKSSK